MMSLSAVKLGLALFTQVVPITPNVFERSHQSLVYLTGMDSVAIQIADDGKLIAWLQEFEPGRKLNGKTARGENVAVILVRYDNVSQLSLLQLEAAVGVRLETVKAYANDARQNEKIFAIKDGKWISGTWVDEARPGLMERSQRYLQLSEFNFEQGATLLSGSPVFTGDGRFVGIVNATLQPAQQPKTTVKIQPRQFNSNYGPGSLVVGYSMGPKVLNRVIDGFLSPSQTPLHPSFGLFYKLTGRQVEVTSVTEGSPAFRAGLRVGDRIAKVDGEGITDSIQLASILFDSAIGELRRFEVIRDGKVLKLELTAGVMEAMPTLQPRKDLSKVLNQPLGRTATLILVD